MGHVRLGVNIDHVATLRQVRAGTVDYPDLKKAAEEAVLGGANQITIHLREDRRHIQDKDLTDLARLRPAPLNLEMAVRDDILAIALKARPDIVCFVPERRQEVTTEGGLDVAGQMKKIAGMVKALRTKKIRSSMFIEAREKQIRASQKVGADAVEFHTGSYALAKSEASRKKLFNELKKSADLAHELGLDVHAGHGLEYENTKLIMELPHLQELNIGHSIVCRALFVGLRAAVQEMRAVMDKNHANRD